MTDIGELIDDVANEAQSLAEAHDRGFGVNMAGAALREAKRDLKAAFDAQAAEIAQLREENEHITDVAKRDGLQAIAQYARAQKAEAELVAAKQQRDTLYSALQYVVTIAPRRKDIREYANHILDVVLYEEMKE